jgi:arylsulfatase A-like enzyme
MTGKQLRSSLAFALVVATSACGDSPLPLTYRQQSVARALTDPQLQSFDYDALSYRFDGQGGSLALADGWAAPEGEVKPFAWVIGTHADLFFGDHGRTKLVLHARVRAFWFEGAPEQLMMVAVNGSPVGSVALTRSWQTVSFELGPEHLVAGLNRIDIDFSYAYKPKDVGTNNDDRELSAMFRWLVVDRAPESIRALEHRRAYVDGAREVLVLESGAEVGLPLPPGTSVSWSGLHRGVQVNLESVGGGWETIWPRADGSTNQSLSIDNSTELTRYLRISRDGGDPAVPLEIPWSPSVLKLETVADATRSPHVFVYVVDTLRKDALEVYGAEREVSPCLQAFARESVVFEHVVTASTWTLPSVASMLTGVYPIQHGVMKGDIALTSGAGYPLLPELLAGAGYETVGISQSFVAGPRFGIDSGFGNYFLSNQLNSFVLRTSEMRRTLTEWLSWQHDWSRPVFVYLHTVGPHAPYFPPSEFLHFAEESGGKMSRKEYLQYRSESQGDKQKAARLRALYDGEVAYADAEFGRFLDLLHYFGLYDDSLIIFTADHGEEFNEHGGFDHGRTMYEEVAEVPMIVKFPAGMEGLRGHREQTRVSLIDVFPTVLEIAEIAESGGWAKSLLDTVGGGSEPRPVFSELNPHANEIYESVDFTASWLENVKCIHSKSGTDRFGHEIQPWRCFDLSTDPQETRPLANDDLRAVACRKALEDWMRYGADAASVTGPAATDEALDMLRAIGYIK